MLLTNKQSRAILQLQSREGLRLTTFKEVKTMIYDKLNELAETEGVSPLAYEVLNCGR